MSWEFFKQGFAFRLGAEAVGLLPRALRWLLWAFLALLALALLKALWPALLALALAYAAWRWKRKRGGRSG